MHICTFSGTSAHIHSRSESRTAADDHLEQLLYKINESKWLRDTGRYCEGRDLLRAVLEDAQLGACGLICHSSGVVNLA